MTANVKVKDLIEMLKKQPEDSVVFVVANGWAYPLEEVRFNNTIDKTEIRCNWERQKYEGQFVPTPVNSPHSLV